MTDHQQPQVFLSRILQCGLPDQLSIVCDYLLLTGTLRNFPWFSRFSSLQWWELSGNDSHRIAAYSKSMEIESNQTERSMSSSSIIATIIHRFI